MKSATAKQRRDNKARVQFYISLFDTTSSFDELKMKLAIYGTKLTKREWLCILNALDFCIVQRINIENVRFILNDISDKLLNTKELDDVFKNADIIVHVMTAIEAFFANEWSCLSSIIEKKFPNAVRKSKYFRK